MALLLTLVSALTSIFGNLVAKYWAEYDSVEYFVLMMLGFTVSGVAYAFSLRYGHFVYLTSLFYLFVPILTILIGLVLFKDRLTSLQVVGLLVSFIGIACLTWEGAWK